MLEWIARAIENTNVLDVNFGLIPRRRSIRALGNNPDIDTGAAEDVWPGGGFLSWLSVATAQEIVSGSANDAAAGTGARTVLVSGLDGSFIEQSEIATMNGTTAAALTKTYLRINNALVLSAGSGETNDAAITIRDAGGGATRAIIPAGAGISKQSNYTVPAGHSLIVREVFGCINRTGGGVVRYATIATMIRTSTGVRRLPLEFSISSSSPYRHPAEIPLPEKTDFMLRSTNVTVDNTDLTAAWIGVLRKN